MNSIKLFTINSIIDSKYLHETDKTPNQTVSLF